jgi:hypothetical protein
VQDDNDEGGSDGIRVPSAPQLQQLPHAGPVGAASPQKGQGPAPSNQPSSARSSQPAPSQRRNVKPAQPGILHPIRNHKSQHQQRQHQKAQPAVVDPSPPQPQPPNLGVQGGVVYPHVSNAPAAVGEDQVQRLQVQTWDD